MDSMNLVAVILSGGVCTGLLPAPRQAYPKSTLSFGGGGLQSRALARGAGRHSALRAQPRAGMR